MLYSGTQCSYGSTEAKFEREPLGITDGTLPLDLLRRTDPTDRRAKHGYFFAYSKSCAKGIGELES